MSRRRATYADIERLPEHLVGEIVDGELFVSPRPASLHAFAAGSLHFDLLGSFQRGGAGGPGGWWILVEPELHLGQQILVPDLAGWRRERMPEFPDAPAFTLAPDWVCEIVSPTTGRLDRTRKMPVYARQGVRHLWLIEPAEQTLEVYRLEGRRWVVAGNHGGKDRVRAEPFDAVPLRMARWWPPARKAAQKPRRRPRKKR